MLDLSVLGVKMKDNIENKILSILEEKQFVKVEDFSTLLFVSVATVRRKLSSLEEKGLITRTHGGAKINDANNFYPSFTFRAHQNSLEKKKIALSAIKLIKNGDLVFIDGSTSAFFIAEYLSEFKDLKVVTNGIDTLSLLSKNKIDAYSTGGIISNANRSVLVGQIAHNSFSSMHADIAFFSAHSVSRDGEVFDIFEEENYLRQTMMKHASVKVLLCDSTKFNSTSPFRLCSLLDIDYIVTNDLSKDYFGKEFSNKIITL